MPWSFSSHLPLRRVADQALLPRINVRANYIIVHGRLSAGSTTKPFSRKVTFTLTPNTKRGRASYQLVEPQPAEPMNPRNLGHKAFVAVGTWAGGVGVSAR